jgi:hypothetical protein
LRASLGRLREDAALAGRHGLEVAAADAAGYPSVMFAVERRP